jgi:cytochrome c
MKLSVLAALASLSLASLAACGNAPPANTGGDPVTAPTTSGAAPADGVDAQIAQGKALYAENCASCHGAAGEGKAGAPAVVGKTALPLDPPAGAKMRKTPFKTASDVYLFSQKTMPVGAGGTLKDAEYWAIVAFDLKANGVALDKKLDATNAGSINLR